MAQKETIALIGATTETGQLIVSRLLNLPCLLLLMDGSTDRLHALYHSLTTGTNEARVDLLSCSREASWEADIILIAENEDRLEAIADRIKEVATGKLVIFITTDEDIESSLQLWLPYTQVVTVFVRKDADAGQLFSIAIMESRSKETLQKADEFFKSLGIKKQAHSPQV
ncbi:MAG: hypothetical protein WKF70_02530 [Chitinophagaceae bacterium]